MKTRSILCCLAVCALIVACGNKTAKKAAEEPAAENQEVTLPDDFIDFSAVQPDGTTLSLSDFVGHGKYILVDFWASWCGPCRREIPNIKKVYQQFHGDRFDVLSVAVSDRVDDSLRAIEEEGLEWNQIVGAGLVPAERYGFEFIPYLILFAPDGTIVASDIHGPEIGEAVAKALGK